MASHNISDPWDVVALFERQVADYAGSKYGVAVDTYEQRFIKGFYIFSVWARNIYTEK